MKEQLAESVQIMGYPKGTDINVLFDTMKKTIEKMKETVD